MLGLFKKKPPITPIGETAEGGTYLVQGTADAWLDEDAGPSGFRRLKLTDAAGDALVVFVPESAIAQIVLGEQRIITGRVQATSGDHSRQMQADAIEAPAPE